MSELIKAKEPFRFDTRLNLTELTGLRASTLSQFLIYLKEAPDSCVYHHTHRFLQQHEYLYPEPANDFVYWITEALGDDALGERIASIDTVRYSTMAALRDKIVSTIEEYLKNIPLAKSRFSKEGEEFHFMKSVSFVLPTDYIAHDLREFADALRKVTIDSLYFHVFEARLRLRKGTNDFSNWIETSIGDKKLADSISRLDPYSYTMEDLRRSIINMVERRISA